MLNIPEALQHEIMKLVPLSVVNDISCFVLYDHHPRDFQNKIDITFCTNAGYLKEVYKKEIISTVSLNLTNPSEVLLLRNSKCELFYLVRASDELIILSRKSKVEVHKRLSNVEHYEVNDTGLIGQACLKIVCKDDAVPLIFDDNFESLGDQAAIVCGLSSDDSLPVLTHLRSKLTEVKYNVKCNESTLKSFYELQHAAAFETYQKIHPGLKEDVFNSAHQEMAQSLNIKTETPWVKVCNKKLVIVINVVNNCKTSLEDVHILVHGSTSPLTYTTKLFKTITTSPYWEEFQQNSIQPNIDSAIVVVLGLKELEQISSRMEFTGIISYRKEGQDQLLPLETVGLSCLDVLGDKFDVLANSIDDHNSLLALISTTEKHNLLLRHIKRPGESTLDIQELLSTYLRMEKMVSDNILVHRLSPYHVLNGLMVVYDDSDRIYDWMQQFSLYARSDTQVTAFLNLIFDAIPYRIIITMENTKISFKNLELLKYNDDKILDYEIDDSNIEHGNSIMKKTERTLQYLDQCMIKMNNSKDPIMQSKIGSEIDLYACGSDEFAKFRNYLLGESSN